MFSTILVPTDGSDHALKATTIACDLAAKYGARVVLLHVLQEHDISEQAAHFAKVEHLDGAGQLSDDGLVLADIPHVYFSKPLGARGEAPRHAVSRGIAESVLSSAEKIARGHGVKLVDAVTTTGDPAEQILDVAAEEKAEGIVMGSRGLSNIKGALFGSVSHKVAHDAKCTCVTVT